MFSNQLLYNKKPLAHCGDGRLAVHNFLKNLGSVTFSGKIKRISADHFPEQVMAKLKCSVIGRAVGRPVIGRRDIKVLCDWLSCNMLSSMLSSI